MEKRITITPSFDKRDPNPAKNYGVGCADIGFYLIGKRGAIQFKAFTGWWLPHLRGTHADLTRYPDGYNIGYHARQPQYEGQAEMTDECQLIGGSCYYDGSSLASLPIGETMVSEGSDAVWKILEQRYIEQFGELE